MVAPSPPTFLARTYGATVCGTFSQRWRAVLGVMVLPDDGGGADGPGATGPRARRGRVGGGRASAGRTGVGQGGGAPVLPGGERRWALARGPGRPAGERPAGADRPRQPSPGVDQAAPGAPRTRRRDQAGGRAVRPPAGVGRRRGGDPGSRLPRPRRRGAAGGRPALPWRVPRRVRRPRGTGLRRLAGR